MASDVGGTAWFPGLSCMPYDLKFTECGSEPSQITDDENILSAEFAERSDQWDYPTSPKMSTTSFSPFFIFSFFFWCAGALFSSGPYFARALGVLRVSRTGKRVQGLSVFLVGVWGVQALRVCEAFAHECRTEYIYIYIYIYICTYVYVFVKIYTCITAVLISTTLHPAMFPITK